MTKGLSGGEAKRLSIAVEILTLPRLILLDEPTSGLDSSIAYEVMSTVREIVNSSVTCLCTIHQPSREIFSFFDQLLLMSAGRLIYFGPAAEAVAYFTQPTLGYSFEGGHRNPAEFVLDVSCGQRLAAGFNMPRQPEDLEVLHKASQYCLTVRPHSVVAEKRAETVQEAWSPHDPDLYVTSSWTQFKMLLERTWVARIRDIPEIRAQLVKSLVTAILMGLVFFKAGDFSTPFYVDGRITSEASSVNSFLFFFTATTMLSNAQTVPYLCKRLPLYRREQAANLYGPAPFWLSAFLTLIPLQLMFHLLICAITYPMVGLSADFGRFMYFVLATYLGSLIVTTAAMALAFGIGMETAALTLFNMFALILTLFAGYLIKCDDIPAYWKWAAEICFVRWIFEAVMVNEWKQYDTDDAGSGTGSGDVLEAYSFDDFGLADVVWISFLFIAGFLVISLYALLPARSRLIKVSDAADVVSVLSSMGSTDSASLSSFGKTGKALTTAVRAQKKRGDLKASLLSGGGTLEETRVEPELALVHKAPLSVDFFRENSKSVDFSGGCRLVFSDLHYTVPQATKTEEKVLLRGITGRAMPGELLALMGASGAGKSTLLDVLAQRKTTGTITGSITYNGRTTLHDSAYMMQDDVHMGMLTVRESIYFAAELRLHQFSKEAKAKRVEQIMDILGLQLVADSTLGTATVRGISGGELRRVSIAVEIVHLPGLMFLDEPTTGLDSSIALEIISAVRNLANQHRTIICTIHQPSEDAFALFDTVLLLAEGRIVYLGPAHAAVDFFVRSPFRFVCNPGVNPAEFIIAVAGSFLQACDGRSVTSGELSAHYLTTDNAVYAALQTPSPSESQASRPGSLTGSEASVTSEKIRNGTMPSSFWYQLTTLLHRRFLALRKDPRAPCAPLIA
jgi:ATP-binding cassette subfamily G (WHITE) protein 2 (SNQ2)